jgi:hypothetical protein
LNLRLNHRSFEHSLLSRIVEAYNCGRMQFVSSCDDSIGVWRLMARGGVRVRFLSKLQLDLGQPVHIHRFREVRNEASVF